LKKKNSLPNSLPEALPKAPKQNFANKRQLFQGLKRATRKIAKILNWKFPPAPFGK